MKLKEEMWAVAKEYARQFGEVVGESVNFWVADDPEVCDFGDTLFFTLDEMRLVVDNLPMYVKKYGSKEAVGQEIRDWVEWWLYVPAGDTAGTLDGELVMERVTKQLRPNINLRAWLNGCPREDREAWSGPDADYMSLQSDSKTLERLIADYGRDARLQDVAEDVAISLERESAKKRERDEREFKEMLGTEAYNEFVKHIDHEESIY